MGVGKLLFYLCCVYFSEELDFEDLTHRQWLGNVVIGRWQALYNKQMGFGVRPASSIVKERVFRMDAADVAECVVGCRFE